jgi:predicted Rossmann fold nucleotide-binding protein DprA/Smf involved in DNA uptake
MLSRDVGRIEILKAPFLKDILPEEMIKKDSYTNPYIYYYGDLGLINDRKNISAIVGSREPDEYSQNITEKISKHLVTKERKIILSGFARGIDAIALYSALECNGKIIAVLANSIDSFINSNKLLKDNSNILLMSLVKSDAIKSKLDYKLEPLRRNKYIYSLSSETFIVECREIGKGGTWKGATEYMRKISIDAKEKTEIFVLRREELKAHKELEARGAKYFEVDENGVKRCSSFRLFN